MPSPLKSPTTMDRLNTPPNPKEIGPPCFEVNSPLPFPSSTVTTRAFWSVPGYEPTLNVAKSWKPSPLKSPTAMELRAELGPPEEGGITIEYGLPGAWVNPPEPFPSSTVTVGAGNVFAVARSGKPSPLKSPTTTATGCAPTANGLSAGCVNP